MTDQIKNKYWIDRKRLEDPKLWFSRARVYSSVCLLIRKVSKKVLYTPEDTPINAVPYLSGISSELYMKGYLVFKNQKPEVVKAFRHDLEKIREECLKYGDKRFENEDLMFLTDFCGSQLMDDGGIRYPDKDVLASFPQFQDALDILEAISLDV